MEQTLVILKPSALARNLAGEVLSRFERKGLIIAGLKMIMLSETTLKEHYSHLIEKPFFKLIQNSMMASPVIVVCLQGKDAIQVVRAMTGATNSRNAAPGTIRGDFSMSGQENIIHASDSVESAKIEVKRFFQDNEIFSYTPANINFLYASDERYEQNLINEL
ncbi:MAG: nucleoside-diphosphate kinase, partial [Muribaculaceae bacterium]